MSDTDLELLARYTRHHAEDAFAEIVRRHIDLVHSAAFRQVRSLQLAEEVAQSTFIKLARQARQLASDTILTAWLYQVARHESIDVVRREARRQLREQIASEMNAMNATAADWTHIEPLLDEAMHALDDTDRTAVLLRYFENKSLREVGATLGTTDDAARKRVNRAVECLREFFAKRGVTVGAGGLIVVISANAVQAAPVGLAVTISSAAVLAGTTIAATATATATKAITMTTLQKTLVVGLTALAVVSVSLRLYKPNSDRALKVATTVEPIPQVVEEGALRKKEESSETPAAVIPVAAQVPQSRTALDRSRRGDAYRSEQKYDAALLLEPTRDDETSIQWRRGLCYRALQQDEKALEIANLLSGRALKWATSPDDSDADRDSVDSSARWASEMFKDQQPYQLEVLAAVEAKAGRFSEAVQDQKRALALLTAETEQQRPAMQARLELYQAGKRLRAE